MGRRIKLDVQTIVLEETRAGKSPAQILAIIGRKRPDAKMTLKALRDYKYRLRSVGALQATAASRTRTKRGRGTRSIRDIVIEATRKGATPKEALAAVMKERPDARTRRISIYIIRRDMKLTGKLPPLGRSK